MKKEFLLLAGLLTAAGCASPNEKPMVRVQACEHVQITNISVSETDGQFSVSGIIRSRSPKVRRVDHIDITLLNMEGNRLLRTKAAANVRMFARKSTQPPTFRVTVPAEGVQTIDLAHHAGAFAQCEL